MEPSLNDCKIPEALEIGHGSLEDPKGIAYTLSFDVRSRLLQQNCLDKNSVCPHQRIANWVCAACGLRFANFRHSLDRGGHNLYFTVLDWNEIELPKEDCIYKGYDPKNVVELREYMMFLINLSIKGKVEIVPNMSKRLSDYLSQRNDLWEEAVREAEGKVLRFDALFESGNLDQVNVVNCEHYVLTVKPDVNTCGTSQWFYFSVTNTVASSTVKFEIVNFTRKMKLYRAGMKIWVWSKKLERESKVKWHKGGVDIEYRANSHKRQADESEDKSFYTLSFKYEFKHDHDTVFFAYTCPYTYSDICSLIAKKEDELEQAGEASMFTADRKSIVKKGISYTRECFAQTICGIPVYEITVTASSKKEVIPLKNRKCIVITSRVHAGETTGSWMLEGFWNFLFSTSAFTLGGSSVSKLVLGLYVVKVFPCLNPDGVVVGNSRTGVEGADLNRVWQNAHPELYPVIFKVLHSMREMKKKREIEVFCDLHTHSDKANSFIYGCPLPVLQTFALWSKTHLLPKMMAKLTDLFSYKDCSFTIHPSKVPAHHEVENYRAVRCVEQAQSRQLLYVRVFGIWAPGEEPANDDFESHERRRSQ